MKRILFLPIFLGVFFLLQCSHKAAIKSQFSIHFIDQSDSTEYYHYRIDFPDTLHYAKLAKAMKKFATAQRESFLTVVFRDTTHIRHPYELEIYFNKAFGASRFVAYKAEYYKYMGGVHGIPGTKTFVYDKKKRQLIELRDLFSDSTALKAISKYIRDVLAQKIWGAQSFEQADSTKINWIKEGTAPYTGNLETFLPFGSASEGVVGLKFIFQPYQVASFAAGMPVITVPASQFYRYLAPEYKKVFIQDK